MRPETNTTPRYDEHDIDARIHAEFSEMPGLRLTLPQASRLFNLERTECERALAALVQCGVLRRQGDAFSRAGSGRQVA